MVVEGEKAPRREAGIILNIAHCQITLIDFFIRENRFISVSYDSMQEQQYTIELLMADSSSVYFNSITRLCR